MLLSIPNIERLVMTAAKVLRFLLSSVSTLYWDTNLVEFLKMIQKVGSWAKDKKFSTGAVHLLSPQRYNTKTNQLLVIFCEKKKKYFLNRRRCEWWISARSPSSHGRLSRRRGCRREGWSWRWVWSIMIIMNWINNYQ